MDYKLSPEEQNFQLNELPSGYKIIEEEKMMGVKTTCIDSRAIVLVGDSIGFFSSLVLLILSPLSLSLNQLRFYYYLLCVIRFWDQIWLEKICGVIGISLGHLSAVNTHDRLIFSSILFNLLEISFSRTKIFFLTAGNNLIFICTKTE